jgi:hypothetical protein
VEIQLSSDGNASFVGRNVQWLNQPGTPNIPWQVMTLLLPPDTALESVQTRLAKVRWEDVAGNWDVRPASPVAALHEDQDIVVKAKANKPVNQKDAKVYGKDAFWPDGDEASCQGDGLQVRECVARPDGGKEDVSDK